VKIIPFSFFRRNAVQVIARDLLGKVLVTCFEGMKTSGRIVETEAYAGVTDRASHAFGGRLTERTRVMYEPGGLSYVYLCYGMHHLCNVVTNDVDVPHAVLIRALEPMDGLDVMQRRTSGGLRETQLCSGPGRLSKALGISTQHTGLPLSGDCFFIGDDGYVRDESVILATPRIGVDYAGDDAALPYRFILRGHPCVSGKKM
jgi:DNA-3-methyladenine glycosylase